MDGKFSITLSQVIKSTLTSFTTQSLYYPQVVLSTTIKIMAVTIGHCFILFSLIWCVIVICVGIKEGNEGKQRNKQTNKPRGLNLCPWSEVNGECMVTCSLQ